MWRPYKSREIYKTDEYTYYVRIDPYERRNRQGVIDRVHNDSGEHFYSEKFHKDWAKIMIEKKPYFEKGCLVTKSFNQMNFIFDLDKGEWSFI